VWAEELTSDIFNLVSKDAFLVDEKIKSSFWNLKKEKISSIYWGKNNLKMDSSKGIVENHTSSTIFNMFVSVLKQVNYQSWMFLLDPFTN
jgi:hypothetical protein